MIINTLASQDPKTSKQLLSFPHYELCAKTKYLIFNIMEADAYWLQPDMA